MTKFARSNIVISNKQLPSLNILSTTYSLTSGKAHLTNQAIHSFIPLNVKGLKKRESNIVLHCLRAPNCTNASVTCCASDRRRTARAARAPTAVSPAAWRPAWGWARTCTRGTTRSGAARRRGTRRGTCACSRASRAASRRPCTRLGRLSTWHRRPRRCCRRGP
uniref:Uncharacterized protein n=1 Tax=Oryza brachyantha TaxID=4533 RepID=J3L3U6_ORYBR